MQSMCGCSFGVIVAAIVVAPRKHQLPYWQEEFVLVLAKDSPSRPGRRV